MSLTFRNIDASPTAPVEQWGPEGVLAAIDRGELDDWSRIVAAVYADPWGEVAEWVEGVNEIATTRGVADSLLRHVHAARASRVEQDKASVAERVRHAIARSGLTGSQFARRVGTSGARLSTYATGKVTPSAAMMVRIEDAAQRLSR